MDHVTSASASDLDAVCNLIEGQQQRPERTIPYFSNEAGAIAEEVTAEDDWADRAWVVRTDAGAAGFLMAEVDADLDRVWWMGPFADGDWATIADALYAYGRPRINATGEELAGDGRHLELDEFARRHGFRAEPASVALRCISAPDSPTFPGRTAVGDAGVTEMTSAEHRAVAALHDRLFPGTHTTGWRLVDKEADRFRCLVARAGSSVVGYVAVESQADGSGYIDFVGVAPEHRRAGLGRVLVAAATNTLFERGASYVHLTVRESNMAARRLYASLGFTEDSVLRPYRKGFTLDDS
ncbi:MAG: GNAT family N-acetyltransferase [Acidimicrobiia bacterium]